MADLKSCIAAATPAVIHNTTGQAPSLIKFKGSTIRWEGTKYHQVGVCTPGKPTLCTDLTVGLWLLGAGLTGGCAESDGSGLLPTMLPAAGAVLKSRIISTALRQPFKSHSTRLPLDLSVHIAWSALLPVSWPAATPSSPSLSRLHPLSGSAVTPVPQVCRGA